MDASASELVVSTRVAAIWSDAPRPTNTGGSAMLPKAPTMVRSARGMSGGRSNSTSSRVSISSTSSLCEVASADEGGDDVCRNSEPVCQARQPRIAPGPRQVDARTNTATKQSPAHATSVARPSRQGAISKRAKAAHALFSEAVWLDKERFGTCRATECYIAAAKQNHPGAQYRLSRRYQLGSGSLPCSEALQRYWLKLAALNGHEEARDAIRTQPTASGNAAAFERRAVIDYKTRGFGDIQDPLEASTSHAMANLLAVTEGCISHDDVAEILAGLFRTPETIPILAFAAHLVESRMLVSIKFGDQGDDGEDFSLGHYIEGGRQIWIRQTGHSGMMACTLIHELTHAVADHLYENSSKTYRTRRQKADFKSALEQSRRREFLGVTTQEIFVAGTMNQAFTDPHYDRSDGYKTERLVRIAELLAHGDFARDILKSSYDEEWNYFMGFCGDCRSALEKRAAGWWAWDDAAVVIPLNDDPLTITDRSISIGVLGRAMASVFGDMRGSDHWRHIDAAIKQLESILRTFDLDPAMTAADLEDFAQALSSFYVPCFSRGTLSRRRQYDFSRITDDVLKAEVARLWNEMEARL